MLLLETFGEECAILALAQFQCLRLPLAKQIRDDLVIDLEDRDEHRGLLADVLERRVLSDKDLVLVVILIFLDVLLLGGLFDLLLLVQVIFQDFVVLALIPSVNFLEKLANGSRANTGCLSSVATLHGERLTCACLAVREDRGVIA